MSSGNPACLGIGLSWRLTLRLSRRRRLDRERHGSSRRLGNPTEQMDKNALAIAVQVAELTAPIAAVGSILFAVRAYRRQMNAQLFVAFTERYEQIMSEFPPEARAVRRGASKELPAQTQS